MLFLVIALIYLGIGGFLMREVLIDFIENDARKRGYGPVTIALSIAAILILWFPIGILTVFVTLKQMLKKE